MVVAIPEDEIGMQDGVKQLSVCVTSCFLVVLQLCFDFMESAADGKLYCIECNPRTSSVITEFHDNTALATGESRL